MSFTKIHRSLLLVAALALLPSIASAFDYNYFEGGYLYRNNDQVDASGFRLAGSVDVVPHVAVFAEYGDTGHYNQIGAGALFHTPINSTLDLNLGASVEHADSNHDSDTGIGLRGGVRWKILSQLEIDPELRFIDLYRGMTSARLGALYRINPAIDIQGAAQVGDEDRVEASLRYNFGPHY
ncbi:MAG: hypothetical protein ACRETW_10065 [Stenotrophobium sp.]